MRRALPLLGLILLVWLISRIDGPAALAAVRRLSPLTLLGASALFGSNLLVKALRWRRLLVAQGLTLPPGVVIRTFFGGVFYGAVTVGRVGELLRAGLAMKYGRSPGAALSSVLFDRGLDALFLVLTAALLSTAGVGLGGNWILLAGVAAAATLLGGSWVATGPVWAGGERFLVRLDPMRRVAERLRRRMPGLGVREFANGIRTLLAPGRLTEAFGWTLVAWGLYFASLWLLAGGILSADVGPGLLVLAASLAALSALIPASFHGLGPRELVFASVLAPVGVPAAEAVTLSLASFIVMLGTSLALGSLGVREMATPR